MARIKVSFDNQIFVNQKFGGISRYFIELFKGLNKHYNIEWKVEGRLSRNIYLKENFPSFHKLYLKQGESQDVLRWILRFNKLIYFLTPGTRFARPDIYHLTYYDAFFFDRIPAGIPRVVTVYDMIDELFDGPQYLKDAKRRVVCGADKIFAISQSTADDIIRLYALDPAKIIVTPLASSLVPAPVEPVFAQPLPGKYILYVGLRNWYKNFKGFIREVAAILQADRALKVVCAGGPPFNAEELQLLGSLDILNQVVHRFINNDSMLAHMYQRAEFFVFPSKYEGFGIPVLEAMNCDCPVLLNNSSSLKEVAGFAGYYFDADIPGSIAHACQAVISSPALRRELIEKGRIRRADFTWEKTAATTINGYNAVLNA